MNILGGIFAPNWASKVNRDIIILHVSFTHVFLALEISIGMYVFG
jgi:hypothetical protein